MEFTCKANVEGIETNYSSGDFVEILVTIEESSETVDAVVLSVPTFGIYEKFEQTEDGAFELNMPIPYDAPTVAFEVEICAINEDGVNFILKETKVQLN